MHKPRQPRQLAICIALLLAGLALRLYFLLRHPFLAGDSVLYQEIASNWLQNHVYGLSTEALPRPTLIRLPGYPILLAMCSLLFGRFNHAELGTMESFTPILLLQIAADLLTCWLLAALAARLFGERTRIPALLLGCLCPFTANYTAVPLTETFTLLTIALAFHQAERWRHSPSTSRVVAIALSLAASILLRPDQGLLAVAILPLLVLPGPAPLLRQLRPALLCCAIVALPFVAWTARNARTFGVFQPLAPRLATDPGERAPVGFQRWFRTWAIDFASTEDAYWKYPEEPVDIRDLPGRAFDSTDQFLRTRVLIEEADVNEHLNSSLDTRFAQLAQERVDAGRLRYYVFLPSARLANMLLRPRLEMLPFEERWWEYSRHPVKTAIAAAYAALNLGYILLAVVGARRAFRLAPPLTVALGVYVLLRCCLLLTLDNSEQRYTLEFFPIWIVIGSALWARLPAWQRSRVRLRARSGADPQ